MIEIIYVTSLDLVLKTEGVQLHQSMNILASQGPIICRKAFNGQDVVLEHENIQQAKSLVNQVPIHLCITIPINIELPNHYLYY